MTRSKPKPARRSSTSVGRRGVPIQVYVSKREHAQLAATARKLGFTVSQLVRNWIRFSGLRGASEAAAAAVADPRQLEIE